jgi:hypothetical protein
MSHREGLLEIHILSGSYGSDGNLRMLVIRKTKDHAVDVLSSKDFPVVAIAINRRC